MGRFGSLLVGASDGTQHSVELDYITLTFGRCADNDLVLNDEDISLQHGRIECDSRGCLLVDLNSATGTFLNGKRITMAALVNLDVIQLGNFTLTYLEL